VHADNPLKIYAETSNHQKISHAYLSNYYVKYIFMGKAFRGKPWPYLTSLADWTLPMSGPACKEPA
jgi:hypothetical protein